MKDITRKYQRLDGWEGGNSKGRITNGAKNLNWWTI